MGDEHDRLAQPTLQVVELGLESLSDDRVYGAEWLIHEQDRWIGGKGASHACPLLLTTGELGRIAGHHL